MPCDVNRKHGIWVMYIYGRRTLAVQLTAISGHSTLHVMPLAFHLHSLSKVKQSMRTKCGRLSDNTYKQSS